MTLKIADTYIHPYPQTTLKFILSSQRQLPLLLKHQHPNPQKDSAGQTPPFRKQNLGLRLTRTSMTLIVVVKDIGEVKCVLLKVFEV